MFDLIAIVFFPETVLITALLAYYGFGS